MNACEFFRNRAHSCANHDQPHVGYNSARRRVFALYVCELLFYVTQDAQIYGRDTGLLSRIEMK